MAVKVEIMDMKLPNDEPIEEEFEEALPMKLSGTDCPTTPRSDWEPKKDEVSLGLTRRRNESGSDEAFSLKEFNRSKIEQLSDDVNIKTETYEHHDDTLNNRLYILPTKCENGMEEPSVSFGCSRRIRNSRSIDKKNDVSSMCSYPKTRHKLMCENVSNTKTVRDEEFSSFAERIDRSNIKEDLTMEVEDVYACNFCSYEANSRLMLSNHMCPSSEKPSLSIPKRREMCSYKSNQNSHLKHHLLTPSGEKLFACEMCSYKTNQKSHLNDHILLHTGEKPFVCNICSYKTNQKSHLKSHLLVHTREKPFACELCSYKANHKRSLKIHIFTHTGEKPFACDLCSYKATQRDSLKKHVLTHMREKSFACELCSYKATLKQSLKEHILTHMGEKPFACEHCSYKTSRRHYLKEHILTHSGEKPFACELCSYKSVRRDSLKEHMLTHTGEKRFACEVCSYKANRKGTLKKHLLKHAIE